MTLNNYNIIYKVTQIKIIFFYFTPLSIQHNDVLQVTKSSYLHQHHHRGRRREFPCGEGATDNATRFCHYNHARLHSLNSYMAFLLQMKEN